MFDLFWEPAPGDLALIRPGSHAAWFMSAEELRHPVRVVKKAAVEVAPGVRMFWCSPTWPLTTRKDRNGRVIVEEPTSQRPLMLEELMQHEAPEAAAEPLRRAA